VSDFKYFARFRDALLIALASAIGVSGSFGYNSLCRVEVAASYG
jgi:hypothetical protein